MACFTVSFVIFFTLRRFNLRITNHNLLAVERSSPLSGKLQWGRTALWTLQFTTCCLGPLQVGGRMRSVAGGFPQGALYYGE